jgi:diguanylate cyclase (GGDEF)-like protein
MAARLSAVLASDKLPSLPGIALKVIELTRNPETRNRELIAVIKSDPALAAKILRTVNSSLFGLRRQVSSIEQAVPLLGSMPLSNLVLTFSLLPSSTHPGPLAAHLAQLWRSSLTQAIAADELVRRSGGGLPAEYFVAGLLQDIGALALLRTLSDEYLRVLDEFDASERPLVEIERERIGVTHVDVGVELCRRWGFAARLQQAIAGHHVTPAGFVRAFGPENSLLQTALATAAAVAEYFCRSQKQAARAFVDELTHSCYGIGGNELHAFLAMIQQRVRETAELFALDTSRYPSYAAIVEAATTQLASVAGRARRDTVTKLTSRNDFQDHLDRRWGQATEAAESLGLLLIDLDYFKQLNDDYGTAPGDQALKWVAELLESRVAEPASLARYGNDEFVMMMSPASESLLVVLAEEIRRAIACHTLTFGPHKLEFTASIGGAVCTPAAATAWGPRELLSTAEHVMNQAKRSGGNQVRVVLIASNGSVDGQTPADPVPFFEPSIG